MVHLAPLDWAIVGLFLTALLGLGLSAKLRTSDAMGFIAAGRALTLPMFVVTLVCTWYGGILGIGESVSYYGVGTWLLLGLPYYVFAAVYAWRLADQVRESESLSIPDQLRMRYGDGTARAGATLLFALGAPSFHLVMVGTLVQVLTGWPLAVCFGVGLLFGLAFVLKGGLLADVRVSMLSFVAMYVGFAAILVFCMTRVPISEAIAKLPTDSMRTFTGGEGWISILSFFLLGAWTLIDPAFHQRVASVATPEVGRRGLAISIVCWFVFDVLCMGSGLYAVALIQNPPANPVAMFPVFGYQMLPAGLFGLFLCGMAGTIVSAMVGYALVSGSTFGRDLWADGREDAATTKRIRIGIVVSAVFAFGVAMLIPSVRTIWYSWGGVTVGALLLPTLLAYGRLWQSQLDARWMLAVLVVSSLVGLSLLGYGIATDNAYLMVTWRGSTFSVGTLVPTLLTSVVLVGLGEAMLRPRRVS